AAREAVIALDERPDRVRDLMQNARPDHAHAVSDLVEVADPGVTTHVARPCAARVSLNMRSNPRSEEHTSELQSLTNLVCRLLITPSPRSTVFPYTTLFRSAPRARRSSRSTNARIACAT